MAERVAWLCPNCLSPTKDPPNYSCLACGSLPVRFIPEDSVTGGVERLAARIEAAKDWIEARQGHGGVDDKQLAALWLLLDGSESQGVTDDRG